MKPRSWDKHLGLASPLKCAAIQSGQTNNPSTDKDEAQDEVGLDVSHHIHLAPEGRGKYFFLDILSYRMSAMQKDNCFIGFSFESCAVFKSQAPLFVLGIRL